MMAGNRRRIATSIILSALATIIIFVAGGASAYTTDEAAKATRNSRASFADLGIVFGSPSQQGEDEEKEKVITAPTSNKSGGSPGRPGGGILGFCPLFDPQQAAATQATAASTTTATTHAPPDQEVFIRQSEDGSSKPTAISPTPPRSAKAAKAKSTKAKCSTKSGKKDSTGSEEKGCEEMMNINDPYGKLPVESKLVMLYRGTVLVIIISTLLSHVLCISIHKQKQQSCLPKLVNCPKRVAAPTISVPCPYPDQTIVRLPNSSNPRVASHIPRRNLARGPTE